MNVVGQTLDDAAGEAFDKGARLLGLGYPGRRGAGAAGRAAAIGAYAFPWRCSARRASTCRSAG